MARGLGASALGLLALLVLSLGLPRLLVLCSGPHCDQRIEFAHHGRHRAEPEQHGHGGATGSGDSACADHDDCTDRALGEGLVPAPLPRTVVLPPHDLSCPVTTPPVLEELPRWSAQVRHQPATGPPRLDQRTELIASTLLLI